MVFRVRETVYCFAMAGVDLLVWWGYSMATISFTKEMKFNKKETDNLYNFLNSSSESNYKVKTPTAKQASNESLKRVFIKKK